MIKAKFELKSSLSRFEPEAQQTEIQTQKPVEVVHKNASSQFKEIAIDEGPLNENSRTDSLVECGVQKSNELKLEICEEYKENNFQKLSREFNVLLDDIILSCSPFIRFKLPLLLQVNKDDVLRKYLPDFYMRYLKSSILSQESIAKGSTDTDNKSHANGGSEELHEFLLMHLSKSFDDEQFIKKYADYKSRGNFYIF